MNKLTVTVQNENGQVVFSSTKGMKGDASEQLETALAAFEDCLAQTQGLDLTENALDVVDALTFGI